MANAKVLELCIMERPAFIRWLSLAFGTPLIYIDVVAGVLAFIGWMAAWFFDMDGTAGFLLWVTPLTVLVTSVVVGFVYATMSLLSQDKGRPVTAKKETARAGDAQPRIHFLGWETTETALSVTEGEETKEGSTPWLTRVTFANESDVPVTSLTAYKVSGHIEFYDAARDRFLFGMVGQWSDGLEDGTVAAGEKQIDIPPDATPYYLDIAIKYDEDDECYGINYDTALRAPTDLRDKQRKLDHGLYTIKIMVHGENVAETFWFGLINRGVGQRVRILRISS
jgi:hypothetical protein